MVDTTNTRKMTVQAALNLFAALPALDGHVEETTVENPKTGEKTTTTKVIPYTFGVDGKGGKIRWNCAKNLDVLEAEHKRFIKLRDKAITEVSGGTGTIKPEDTEAMTKLNKITSDLLDTEIEVNGLLNISLADLRLDDNPDLSPSALRPLLSLITE